MALQADFTHAQVDLATPSLAGQIERIHSILHDPDTPMCGWVDYPLTISEALVADILATAAQVRQQATAFIVIGIGGSYLGAKAAFELLASPFHNELHKPKIYFAGHHLSSSYYCALLEKLEQEDVYLCAISKSGQTLESSIIFTILKDYLEGRYGDDAAKRIIAITDAQQGILRAEVTAQGYKSFAIPRDIGGRYSVLTPVGLLPMAVAGIDIRQVLAGARQGAQAYGEAELANNICYQYAACRHFLAQQGKTMEIFEVYEGKLRYFTEWLKQLFGESECKQGRGHFPAALQMSTDLHSLGQFLQEGRQDFFETTLMVVEPNVNMPIPQGLAGNIATLHQLNKIIQLSVRDAHLVNQTPNISITIERVAPFDYGEMVYFFAKACAVSSYLTGVNPFDQPGVEAYKKRINDLIAAHDTPPPTTASKE